MFPPYTHMQNFQDSGVIPFGPVKFEGLGSLLGNGAIAFKAGVIEWEQLKQQVCEGKLWELDVQIHSKAELLQRTCP